MNKTMNSRTAYEIAVSYAHIAADEPRCTRILKEDGLYSLMIQTLLMRYEFYVDAENGEVLGLNYEPAVNMEDAYSMSGEQTFPAA